MNKPCRTLTLNILVLLTACSGRHAPTPQETLQAYSQVQALVASKGQIQGALSSEYLGYLSNRLTRSLPAEMTPSSPLQIVLIDSEQAFAATPGAGYVVISRALLLKLHNEGELAFIVAHELAHTILGHNMNLANDASERREMESQADARALGIIALAGYDPRVAVAALTRAANHLELWDASANLPDYPALDERIHVVQDLTKQSGWSPPGTVDRRDFQLLRKALL